MFIIMYKHDSSGHSYMQSIPYKCCKVTGVLQYAHANVHLDYSYCEMTFYKHHKGMVVLHCV